jgi:hypothetical protein
MLVTLLGIVRLVRPLQPMNAPSPMLVTPLEIVRLVRPVHPSNAPLPMLVTPLGIVRLVRPLQPMNALSPMLVTLLGIVRLVRSLQHENARLPMATTGRLLICEGMLTEVTPLTGVYASILTPLPYEEYVKLPDVAAEAGPIRPATMSRERMNFFIGVAVCTPDNDPMQGESGTGCGDKRKSGEPYSTRYLLDGDRTHDTWGFSVVTVARL